MTREQALKHSQVYSAACLCHYSVEMSDTENSITSILNMIYKDVDGERRGDIAVMLSDKTSPEIREFIRQNILRPVSTSVSGVDYSGLSDDDIALYTRDAGESRNEYLSRLRDMFERDASYVKASKDSNKLSNNG